jgi:hypothetical protein
MRASRSRRYKSPVRQVGHQNNPTLAGLFFCSRLGESGLNGWCAPIDAGNSVKKILHQPERTASPKRCCGRLAPVEAHAHTGSRRYFFVTTQSTCLSPKKSW